LRLQSVIDVPDAVELFMKNQENVTNLDRSLVQHIHGTLPAKRANFTSKTYEASACFFSHAMNTLNGRSQIDS